MKRRQFISLLERGELGRVLVYADHPIIARKAFAAAVEQYVPQDTPSAAQPRAGDGGTQAEMMEV